jgi:hypothetical protein
LLGKTYTTTSRHEEAGVLSEIADLLPQDNSQNLELEASMLAESEVLESNDQLAEHSTSDDISDEKVPFQQFLAGQGTVQ